MTTFGFDEKGARRIVLAVKRIERQVKSIIATDRRASPHHVGGRGGGVKRAKITTAPSATSATISATLVDEVTPTPNLVGSAFDVYLRASKASVTLADHAPTLSNNGYIHVQKIGANYYLIPELLELDDCV